MPEEVCRFNAHGPGLGSCLLDCCSFCTSSRASPTPPPHPPPPFCFYTCMPFNLRKVAPQLSSDDSHRFLWPADIVLCDPITHVQTGCVCSGCCTPVMSLMPPPSYLGYGVYMHTQRNQDYPIPVCRINICVPVAASHFRDSPSCGDLEPVWLLVNRTRSARIYGKWNKQIK